MRKRAPASTFFFRNAMSESMSGASGCTSGKHAAPMLNS